MNLNKQADANSVGATKSISGVIAVVFSKKAWPWWLAFFAGFALRLFFILKYPEFDGDTGVYGAIAKNILQHHVYGLGNPMHPTLIRLPGYPLFLAGVFSLFGMENYAAARPLQLVIDLASCLLLAAFVRDHVSRRAALWALWIAALCPFTANYVAHPLTETPSIFLVALAMFAAGRLIVHLREGRAANGYLVLTAFALCAAIEFRPDGGLLSAAFLPGIWWYTRRAKPKAAARSVILCTLLIGLPFIPWTIRNYRVFHVFQPLAPRFANDPGELPLPGYMRWTKTWLADYVSSPEFYWRGDSETLDVHMLPNRAFDSPKEYQQTDKLLDDYNEITSITVEIDDRFNALAEQRIRRHPVRFYVVMPLMRLADMWFRPRTEQLYDATPIRWWEVRKHPIGSIFPISYGLLNLALVTVGIIGFVRGRVPFAGMFMTYIIFRCLLLMTIENAEPRYTLEAFPIVIAAAAVALAGRRELRPGNTLAV